MTISQFYETRPDKPYAQRILDANPYVFKSFRRFALQGRLPGEGSFVWACLTNDLSTAVGKADPDMSKRLEDIVMYMNNCLPMGCWGSDEAVNQWAEEGGLVGSLEESESHAVWVAQDSGM